MAPVPAKKDATRKMGWGIVLNARNEEDRTEKTFRAPDPLKWYFREITALLCKRHGALARSINRRPLDAGRHVRFSLAEIAAGSFFVIALVVVRSGTRPRRLSCWSCFCFIFRCLTSHTTMSVIYAPLLVCRRDHTASLAARPLPTQASHYAPKCSRHQTM